jgi:HEAT repeats
VPTPGPSLAAIDAIIVECLNGEPRSAIDRAVAVGEPMLRRLVDLYYGHSSWIEPPRLTAASREIGDAWTGLLFRLAMAFPGVYLDEIDARRIRLKGGVHISEVVILGYLDDPRAVPLLVRCTRHRDWLVRYHAVRGLAHRDDPESVAAVEHAAGRDCDVAVRVEAVAGIARRNPARARTLYTGLLDHPHLTPMLAEHVRQALYSTAQT